MVRLVSGDAISDRYQYIILSYLLDSFWLTSSQRMGCFHLFSLYSLAPWRRKETAVAIAKAAEVRTELAASQLELTEERQARSPLRFSVEVV